jgi:hypothetical protein
MNTVASIATLPVVRSRWYRSVGAVLAGPWTHWYSLAIIAVTLPSSWLGARVFLGSR